MPLSNRFYPRYKGYYLFYWGCTGKYSLENNIGGCNYGKNEKEAMRIIDEYLESLGVGTTIIKIKE
jgi:hypothetical protein